MEKLEALASIARISENVVRVLGQNPGKFTLQGTNTYIIGLKNPYTLIDTGEGRPEYIPLLESALRETAPVTNPEDPDISDIIISHWHHDHVGGLPGVLDLLRRLWDARNPTLPFKPPRLHKFPLPVTAQEVHDNVLATLASASPNSYTPTPQGTPFHDLSDSQSISSLQVLHTPGHTLDSICLYIPDDQALYTADTVLGQGTAVFENLKSYISSLQKMYAFGEDHVYTELYPGHGPVVKEGKQLIKTYIEHRLQREAQIFSALKSPPPSPSSDSDPAPATSLSPIWTTWTLVKTIYASYPESLWLPAARSVDQHLQKLEEDGVVEKVGGEGVHTRWLVKGENRVPLRNMY